MFYTEFRITYLDVSLLPLVLNYYLFVLNYFRDRDK